MTPQLSEALRSEIRSALEADGKPFDVNVARRVYDLSIAARDMCVAATSGVAEAIATIKDVNGPLESLDSSDTPESQMQASETFGARLIREIMAMLPMLQQKKTDDPKMLVHALAEARKRGMTDVAEELEVKLFGHTLSGEKSIDPDGEVVITVPKHNFEHGFADGKADVLPETQDEPYQAGYLKGTEARFLDKSAKPNIPVLVPNIPVPNDPPLCEACVKDPDPRGGSACFNCREIRNHRGGAFKHVFTARTTGYFLGPKDETCEWCGSDPRNVIHVDHEAASRLMLDSYQEASQSKALTLDEAERLYKENLLEMP